MVKQRFTELDVDFVIQNREDKGQALGELAEKLNFEQEDLGYMEMISTLQRWKWQTFSPACLTRHI